MAAGCYNWALQKGRGVVGATRGQARALEECMQPQSTTVPRGTVGVYVIEDLGSGRVYVGSSVDVAARLRRHRNMLERGTHFCQHLQNAYRLRGSEAFVFRLVVQTTVGDMRRVEEAIIRGYPLAQLYNRILVPQQGVLGLRWTMPEATKRKIGDANRGRGHPQSAETRAKIAMAARGRRMPEETKQKLREAMRNYPADARARISAANTGRVSPLRGIPLSVETKRKLSAANAGKTYSMETRARMSAAQQGRVRGPHSEATRQKISAAKVGRHWPSPSLETRAKMSAAQTERWRQRKARQGG